jgi:hypothetical protein
MRSQTDRRPPQRSDHRREAILDALDDWLLESNLDAINIAEISKQAGVTRSAFYIYFENKGAAYGTNLQFAEGEFTFVKTPAHHGTREAFRLRDEHFYVPEPE